MNLRGLSRMWVVFVADLVLRAVPVLVALLLVSALISLLGWALLVPAYAPGDTPSPTTEKIAKLELPITFATTRERRYWDALITCDTELRIAERRLEGEVRKVATATATCNLTCPPIPECPGLDAGEGGPGWLGLVGGIVGGAAGGFALGQATKACPDVIVR